MLLWLLLWSDIFRVKRQRNTAKIKLCAKTESTTGSDSVLNTHNSIPKERKVSRVQLITDDFLYTNTMTIKRNLGTSKMSIMTVVEELFRAVAPKDTGRLTDVVMAGGCCSRFSHSTVKNTAVRNITVLICAQGPLITGYQKTVPNLNKTNSYECNKRGWESGQ